MESLLMSSALIDTIRTLVNEGGMSRSGLARAAGLHANSLRKLGEPDWNPTADTLGKLESYLLRREGGTALASPEEIINEARNGRMFILVDDEDRENEGDLVIPAQMATPDAINFMATHGRGHDQEPGRGTGPRPHEPQQWHSTRNRFHRLYRSA
jgi:3,4-dihydroxy 2-butanone 4-phosphate synthase/GTP cyclohydrolase II